MKTPTTPEPVVEDFGPSFFAKTRQPIMAPVPENEALTLNRRRTEALESIAESLRFIAAGETRTLS